MGYLNYVVGYQDSDYLGYEEEITVTSDSRQNAIKRAMSELTAQYQYSYYDESARIEGNEIVVIKEGIEAFRLVKFRVLRTYQVEWDEW